MARVGEPSAARESRVERMRAWSILLVLVLAAVVCLALSASGVVEVPNPPNTAEQQAKHYVVLVSLDGFRYDYPSKYGAKNLQAMAVRGASAPDGMIPSYPAVTFPNHFAIVTGLYPEHHGIVANSFYDPVRKEFFSYTNPKVERDGSWYSGTPLWVLAEQQGMRTACFFWPSSDTQIEGKRPSYYFAPYDDGVPDEKRVEQTLAWLQLPPAERPHFIALYFPKADDAGHEFGPDSPQMAETVRSVDDAVGELAKAIAATKLPVDLIVLSDHGMETQLGGWVPLDRWADLSQFETVGALLYPKSEADAQKAYQSLSGVSNTFKIYRRADMPEYLHYNSNPREGDPIVVPTGPYSIVAHDPNAAGGSRTPSRGGHGYDPRQMPSMKAIFFAVGPDIRTGVTLPSFENVDVYPLIARILGLRIGAIDGQLAPVEPVLTTSAPN